MLTDDDFKGNIMQYNGIKDKSSIIWLFWNNIFVYKGNMVPSYDQYIGIISK